MEFNKYLQFIEKYKNFVFYQPVILKRGIVEIDGKWNEATKKLAKQLFEDKIKNKSIVDVGACTGYFLHEARYYGASHCTGYEIDSTIYNIANEINELIQDNCEIINENILNTKNLKRKYDIGLLFNFPPNDISQALNIMSHYCPKIFAQIPYDYDMSKIQNAYSVIECERCFTQTQLIQIDVFSNNY